MHIETTILLENHLELQLLVAIVHNMLKKSLVPMMFVQNAPVRFPWHLIPVPLALFSL